MPSKWLFMVYMAGDNGKLFPDGQRFFADLSGEGWSDLAEMASVGSTDGVKVVAQFDNLDSNQKTPRFYVHGQGKGLEKICEVSSVNTGDPRNLTDFVVWAMTEYPAERVALVLWNHGTGWDETDIYARYRDVEGRVREDRARGIGPRRRLGRLLFLNSAAQVMRIEDDDTRAICYDDSSMDFLDNADLDSALGAAVLRTGRRLDVIGMDACLMGMAEVAYAVRPHADFMIASQEVEAADGWPYARILGPLVANPEMDPTSLSRLIVTEFGNRYGSITRSGGRGTLSALNLDRMDQVFEALGALAVAFGETLPNDFNLERGLNWARQEAQRFADRDSVDLAHLLERVSCHYSGTLSARVDEVRSLLLGQGIEQNWSGSQRRNANGLSIYCPGTGFSPFYDRQAFARTGWNRVVRTLNRVNA